MISSRYLVFILFFAIFTPVIFSQNFHKINAVPTSSNFTYPQSVFVDSKNGNIWVTDFDNNRVLRFDAADLSGNEENTSGAVIKDFSLNQNYPNPFNAATQIEFTTKNSVPAKLIVSNIIGQQVALLFNGTTRPGEKYRVSFDAKNLPSGVYIYSLKTEYGSIVRKMCLLK